MKPIVFLVDSIKALDGEIYIKTAYETMTDIFPTRMNQSREWMNAFLGKYMPGENIHRSPIIQSTNISYELLDDAIIASDKIYIYLIPCKSELDVGLNSYLYHLTESQFSKIVNNNISILYDYSLEVYEFPRFGTQALAMVSDMLTCFNPNYSGRILVSSANKSHDGCPPLVVSVNLPLRAIHDRRSYLKQTSHRVDLGQYFAQQKQYLFLHLNMQPRRHRIFFLRRLIIADLVKHARVSFMTDISGIVNFTENQRDTRCAIYGFDMLEGKQLPANDEDYAVFHEVATTILPPKRIDDDILFSNEDQNFLYNDKWIYDTCFDLISETGGFTNFPGSSPVISEKTFKSIFYKRPFMLVGDKGNLQMLRDMGFKTFPTLFDESYDLFDNMFDRHRIIVDNIKRYAYNYQLFMDQAALCRDILEHNYTLLIQNTALDSKIVDLINQVYHNE
jgi:hypothetical protein